MKLAPEIKAIGKKYRAQINGIEASIRKYSKIAIFRHIMPDFNIFFWEIFFKKII